MNTTSSLSNAVSVFYDKVFLKTAYPSLMHYQFAQKRYVPKGEGKTINFTRYARLATPTVSLTEGSNGNETNLSAVQVQAVIVEEGAYTKVSSLFEMTSIDQNLKNLVQVMGKQAGETVDSRVRNEIALSLASRFANSKVLSTIAVTDVLNAKEVKLAVRTLDQAFAMRFDDGYYASIITPSQQYDLMADSATGSWIDVNKYTTTENAYKGEIGKLYGARIVVSPIGYRSATSGTTYSSTGAVHYAQFFGQEAFGVCGIESVDPTSPKIIVKRSNDSDTSNPLNMFSTVGWKLPFKAKTLNTAFGVSLRTGATA